MKVLLTTMVIDTYGESKVATFDVHWSYLQTDLPKDKFALLLMEVNFVDIMCDINSKYKHQFRFKYGRKTLYLCIIKSLYGIIGSALIWY